MVFATGPIEHMLRCCRPCRRHHERQSCDILDYIVRHYNVGLSEEECRRAKDMILGSEKLVGGGGVGWVGDGCTT